MQIAIKFGMLFNRKDSGLRTLRKFQHSFLVAILKGNREQEFGGFGGGITVLRANQSGPNIRLSAETHIGKAAYSNRTFASTLALKSVRAEIRLLGAALRWSLSGITVPRGRTFYQS